MDSEAQRKKQLLVDFKASLFQEGFLNDQFTQLQQLQDEASPDFVGEVMSLFFQDSERLFNELGRILQQQNVDFRRMDSYVHQLKGSSSSIGAQRVQNICMIFRSCCDEQNIEGCLQCLQHAKQEYALVKGKLETLLKLEQQVSAASGGSGSM